jgi:regulator of protease activity HflC (stomatin/prohibitin superfamily)
MRAILIGAICGLGGCATTIQPGHMGILFDPTHGGVQHNVLSAGRWRHGARARVDAYDVTYATKHEALHTRSAENAEIDVTVSVQYRPIVSELYDLEVEVAGSYAADGGASPYDEVIAPEFRTATRGVIAHHSYLELQRINSSLEDEIEVELRKRIAGKHMEISSVTLESLDIGGDVASSIRAKLVGEQEAIRKKTQAEADALRKKLELEADSARKRVELEHEAERAKLEAEASVSRKENERVIAIAQAAIDKVQAETEAQVRVTRAKAEAQAITVLAKAHADEKRAEATTVTPLVVMLHAYDSLAKLGGTGTNIMLGDWSHVPSFLFPNFAGLNLGGAPRASAR